MAFALQRPQLAVSQPCAAFNRSFLPAFATRLNRATREKVSAIQEYFILGGKSLRFIFARPFYHQDVVQQMEEIGVKSLGIVLLTGFFTGMDRTV